MSRKIALPILAAGALALVLTLLHAWLTGDRLARFLNYTFIEPWGYYISIFVMPGLILSALLLVAALMLSRTTHGTFRNSWLWLILAFFITYLPIFPWMLYVLEDLGIANFGPD